MPNGYRVYRQQEPSSQPFAHLHTSQNIASLFASFSLFCLAHFHILPETVADCFRQLNASNNIFILTGVGSASTQLGFSLSYVILNASSFDTFSHLSLRLLFPLIAFPFLSKFLRGDFSTFFFRLLHLLFV